MGDMVPVGPPLVSLKSIQCVRFFLNISSVRAMNDTSKNSAAKKTSDKPSDDSPRNLWCLIEGDDLIRVTVAANKPIYILKELVCGKTFVYDGIYAKDLVLLKVSDTLESGSSIYVRFVRLIYLSMSKVPQI